MGHTDYLGLLIIIIYAALFMAALIAVAAWDRYKRRTRKPFGEDMRLMRMPGEYLLRRVIEKDASEMEFAIGLMLLPVIVSGFAFQIATRLSGRSSIGLVIVVIVFALVLLLCIRWLLLRLQRRQDEYLGFFGERIVADCLEPLKTKGWFIFHDLQCDGATGKFNLDHVAVGPGGIWVIETKTWRKRRARPGMKEHEIEFDGAKVIWPWGDENDSIKQAANNTDWLRKWLQGRLGKTFDVSAILAFPGYFVTERKLGAVRLANPKKLPDVLTGRGNALTNAEELDLIRRQLESLCRDVKF